MSYFLVGAVVVSGASIAGVIDGQRAAKKEADRKRKAEILGAQLQYSATESSVNLMKASSRESTLNTIYETLRVGAAQNKEVEDAIRQASSTLMSKSEGLTSGKAKGRQMISLYTKGNKALQETKSQTISIINQLSDKQDQYTNDLNNKLFQAHQQMSSVLTTPGSIYYGSNMAVVSAGLQGAAAGASLASNLSTATTFGGSTPSAAPQF